MSNHSDVGHKEMDYGLTQVPTNMTLTNEQFERLYLAPKNNVSGDLRKTFGNPTPVAIMGFIVALTPLSISFMGWRGSGGGGVATTTASLWFGGALLLIVALLEFFLGNTFPSVVFFGFGAHFVTLGTTFIPWFNAVSAFTTDGTQTQTPEFLSSFAFYLLAMGLLSTIFLVCSIRTNAVFFLVFLTAALGFYLAAGGFWMLATGNASVGGNLIVATGASFFVAALLGWYLFLALMLATMDLPTLPVFDLSTKIKGVSERRNKPHSDADLES